MCCRLTSTKTERIVQTTKHDDVCNVIISFYKVKKSFGEACAYYEKKGKFDFSALGKLEEDLYMVKEGTHSVFRYGGEVVLDRPCLFDLVIGSIFHELLHLKEYVYTLESYQPKYRVFEDKQRHKETNGGRIRFLDRSREIVKEAKENLPAKTEEIKDLFEDALSLLDAILKKYRASRRLIRVLYLEREIVESIYGKGGLEKVYDIMYPGGAMEGYFRAGASFLNDGFYKFAVKAFEESLDAGKGSKRENEIKGQIKKKCQLLEKKRPGMTGRILARL